MVCHGLCVTTRNLVTCGTMPRITILKRYWNGVPRTCFQKASCGGSFSVSGRQDRGHTARASAQDMVGAVSRVNKASLYNHGVAEGSEDGVFQVTLWIGSSSFFLRHFFRLEVFADSPPFGAAKPSWLRECLLRFPFLASHLI